MVPLALALLALAAGRAHATQIVQTVNFSTSQINALSVPATLSLFDTDSGAVNRFDAALGALDSVDIAVSGSASSAATALVQALLCGGLAGPCFASVLLRLYDMELQLGMPGYSPGYSFADRAIACSGAVCPVSLASNTTAFAGGTTLTGGVLGDYIGGGTFAVNVFQLGFVSLAGPMPPQFAVFFEGRLKTSGTVKITYNYTPPTGPGDPEVAEPAAIGIFAIGLAGLGFLRRRRRAHR